MSSETSSNGLSPCDDPEPVWAPRLLNSHRYGCCHPRGNSEQPGACPRKRYKIIGAPREPSPSFCVLCREVCHARQTHSDGIPILGSPIGSINHCSAYRSSFSWPALSFFCFAGDSPAAIQIWIRSRLKRSVLRTRRSCSSFNVRTTHQPRSRAGPTWLPLNSPIRARWRRSCGLGDRMPPAKRSSTHGRSSPSFAVPRLPTAQPIGEPPPGSPRRTHRDASCP